MNIPNNTSSKNTHRKIGQQVLCAILPSSIKPKKYSFLRRIDIRLPWLKIVVVCLIGSLAIVDLLDFTVSVTSDPSDKIRIAPMSKHVRATKRIFQDRMLVALTFDDGPSAETTPRLLDILLEQDVPVTFFALGNMASRHPDIIQRAANEGHIIGSHTMYHQNLIRISPEAARSDVNAAKMALFGILGRNPELTRPPYGNYNDIVRDAVGTPMILWSVDTLDWQSRNVDAIIETTMSQIHDGAIILMHDIYPSSVEAVPRLIEILRGAGYEFVTVPELAEKRGISLDLGTAYYNFRP